MAKQVIPMNIKVLDGKKSIKKSNKFIEDRLEHENKMNVGGKEFLPFDKVLKSKVALKRWKELIKIYKQFEFVNDIDNDTINNYCLLCADLNQMYEKKDEIENNPELDLIAKCSILDKLKITYNILKMHDTKLKYEDKLFLTPASRLRSLPRKDPPKEETYLEKMGFGNV